MTAVRPAKRIAWLAPLAVNAAFGMVAVLPIALVWYFLANYPLAALGVTERDPTDDDGLLPHLIMLAGVGVLVALWAAVNHGIRTWLRLPGRLYWLASTAALFVPCALIWVFPAVRDLWAMAPS